MHRSTRRRRTSVVVLFACAAVLGACGEAADDDPDPTVSTPAEMSPTTEGSATPTDGTSTATPRRVTVGKGQEHRITTAEPALVACDGGGEVKVLAAATVTATGPCGEIDVDTDGATVTFETVRDLGVDGSDNTITGVRTLELDVGGSRNEIMIKQLRAVDVEGSDNTILHGSALTPRVDDEGQGNTIGEG